MAAPLSQRFLTPLVFGANRGPGLPLHGAARSALAGSLMLETAGTGVSVVDFRPGDFQTGFNDSMQRNDTPRTGAAWLRMQEWVRAAPSLATIAARASQPARIRGNHQVH